MKRIMSKHRKIVIILLPFLINLNNIENDISFLIRLSGFGALIVLIYFLITSKRFKR